MVRITQVEPVAVLERSHQRLHAGWIEEPHVRPYPLERPATGRAGQFVEKHQLQAGIDLILRKERTNEAENGQDALSKPESFKAFGIDIPYERFTDLLAKRTSLPSWGK